MQSAVYCEVWVFNQVRTGERSGESPLIFRRQNQQGTSAVDLDERLREMPVKGGGFDSGWTAGIISLIMPSAVYYPPSRSITRI